MGRCVLAAGLVAALAVVGLGSPARAIAASASGAEVRRLASLAAAGDQAALDALRAIDEVDGARVDLARSLPASVRAPAAAPRLETLAVQPSAAAGDAETARADAQRLLAGPPYTRRHRQGILHDALARIGSAIEAVARPFGRFGHPLGWLLIGIVIAAACGAGLALARARARRVSVGRASRARGGDARARADAGQLERLADAAEAGGEIELALRLRFEAGLVRLDRAGAIVLRDSTTSGAVSEALGPSSFDPLAATHDDVVYGGRAAAGRDLAEARAAWPRVLDEASRR